MRRTRAGQADPSAPRRGSSPRSPEGERRPCLRKRGASTEAPNVGRSSEWRFGTTTRNRRRETGASLWPVPGRRLDAPLKRGSVREMASRLRSNRRPFRSASLLDWPYRERNVHCQEPARGGSLCSCQVCTQTQVFTPPARDVHRRVLISEERSSGPVRRGRNEARMGESSAALTCAVYT